MVNMKKMTCLCMFLSFLVVGSAFAQRSIEVDKRQLSGQFILTGSNVVDETQIRHSGTGRISRLQMGTMSLWESQESNGMISLSALFDNPQMAVHLDKLC